MKAIRHVVLALTLTLIGATSMTDPSLAQTQAQATSPTTTGVMVILTVKAGVRHPAHRVALS